MSRPTRATTSKTPQVDACEAGAGLISDQPVTTGANAQVTAPDSGGDGTMNPAPNGDLRPARGYSWPPFEPGHTLSLVHGGYSETAIEARAAEVRVQLFDLAPWLQQDAFVPAVARFLRAEARERLIHEHIVKVSAERGAGAVPQRLWESATACANASMKASALLGLDPQSYARLRATTGTAAATEAGLADLAAQGRQIVQAHQPSPAVPAAPETTQEDTA